MNDSVQSSCPKCGAPIAGDAPQGLCPKCVLAQAATEFDPGPSASKRTPPPTVAEVAAHFPDLEIEEMIGVGGMGAVYKARQSKLDRVVALKILCHDLGEDPAFVERFNREGRVLGRLSHPNIVAIYDTGTAGPYAFLLMEYVDGVNLRQAMGTGGFTPAEALSLVEEICTALKFAHGEGILHRDIKPENILIDARGQVKIADFGIAKLVDQDGVEDLTLTLDGSILGSPQYMAPEQIETPGDIDQRADIYSLGVVFYEMLTGELPMGRFALPSEKSPIDARIDEIVLRTLAKEREARFQTAGEVQTQVEAIHATPALPPLSSVEASAKGDWLSRAAKFLSGLVIVFAALIILDPWSADDDPDATLLGAERITLFVWIAVSFSMVSALLFGLHRYRSWKRETDGKLPFPPAAENWTSMGLGSPGEIARFATASAILTGLSLLLCAWTLFMWKDIEGSVYTIGGWVGFFLAAFLPPLVPCVLAIILGAKAIHAIRLSGGQLGGFFRSVFGVMTMPILAGALLLTMLIANLFGWYQLPSLAIRTDGISELEWRQGEPEFEINLSVAPRQVATFELVRKDAAGKETVIEEFQGYVLAADSEAWQGTVKIGWLPDGSYGGSSQTLLKGAGSPAAIVIESSTGKREEATGGLPDSWVLVEDQPADLELSVSGEHRVTVGQAPDVSSPDASGVLELRIVCQPRKVPGVPMVALDQVEQAEPVIGMGSRIEWVRQVMEALEASLPEGGAFQPPREPEPEWRQGKPEFNLAFSVAPGLVATFDLIHTDAAGQEQILDTGEHPGGYVVASDLETWEGAIRIGTLTENGNAGSVVQVRIDGPQFSATADDAHLANWVFGQRVSSLDLAIPGQESIRLATRLGDGASPSSADTLSLRVVTTERPRESGIPEVLAFQLMGMGSSDNWLPDLQRMIEITDRMDAEAAGENGTTGGEVEGAEPGLPDGSKPADPPER